MRLVSYATRPFRRSQRLLAESAARVGGVERVFAHSPRDLDRRFRRRHAAILRAGRGAGYWLWKPYLVERHLRDMRDGEWLLYCDAGAYLVAPPTLLARHADEHGLDVVVFELEPFRLEAFWTKRDAFVLLGCDRPRFWASPQRQGTCSLWRTTPFARRVAAEWLDAACDPRAIGDAPNACGLPNLPGFRDHRHDQSLLSLVTKRHGIPAWRDPTQYGNDWAARHPESRYPQVIQSTREREPSLRSRLGELRRRVIRREE